MAEQTATRPVCGEPAEPSRFFRCDKPAGHTGDRHHTTVPGGSYTWGYVPTKDETTEANRG